MKFTPCDLERGQTIRLFYLRWNAPPFPTHCIGRWVASWPVWTVDKTKTAPCMANRTPNPLLSSVQRSHYPLITLNWTSVHSVFCGVERSIVVSSPSPILRPFVLFPFALTLLASLHPFLICVLSFSV